MIQQFFFPIYKIIGPIFVIFAGVFFFQETFSLLEWLGLSLSLLVPLLLISRDEKGRQQNLWTGIRFLILTAALTSVAAVISKEIATNATDIWFAIALGDIALAVAGTVIFVSKNRKNGLKETVLQHSTRTFIWIAILMGVGQAIAFAMIIFAYRDGPLGIIYTVHSLYILIPIILSIIFYNEHWSARKVVAIVLSVAALALLQ